MPTAIVAQKLIAILIGEDVDAIDTREGEGARVSLIVSLIAIRRPRGRKEGRELDRRKSTV